MSAEVPMVLPAPQTRGGEDVVSSDSDDDSSSSSSEEAAGQAGRRRSATDGDVTEAPNENFQAGQ
eukprot:15439848-Alexandrium_andersonii.AAC.1